MKINVTEQYPNVVFSANIANADTAVYTTTVPPTETYVVFSGAVLKLFLRDSGNAALPAISVIRLAILDPQGKVVKDKIWESDLRGFNTVNQYNVNEQITLALTESYVLPELYRLVLTIKSTAVVHQANTSAAGGMQLQVLRTP